MPTLILQAFANAGDLVVPPQTDPSGFVNWHIGYTLDYEIDLTSGNPQAKAVERKVQNALFNILSDNQMEWQRRGFSEWYSSMPGGYEVNAQVSRQNGSGIWTPYRSLVAANVSDPLTSSTWTYVPNSAEALANVPMPTGGASGPAAEVVTTATDFNSFATGTWEYQSDAIAAGSAHAPAQPGGTSAAGLLESKSWANGGNTYIAQRYLDRNGSSFFRGATNGTWTTWNSTTAAPIFSTDVSTTVNLVSATFPIPSSSIPDNSLFWVKIANTSTGALTFTPNASIVGALPVVGLGGVASQGGEVVASGRAMFVYKADTNSFVLAYCTSAPIQIAAAQQSGQAVNLGQVNALIATSASPSLLYFLGQI